MSSGPKMPPVWDDAWLPAGATPAHEDPFAEGINKPVLSDLHQADPIAWLCDILKYDRRSLQWSSHPAYKTHEWDGTPDPLMRIAYALAAGQNVAVESGVGTGKTYFTSGIAPWYLLRHEDSLVLTLAPKEDQLTLQMWRYLSEHLPTLKHHYPMLQDVHLRLRVRPVANGSEKWAMIGYAVGVDAGQKSAVRAQGFHAEYLLAVTEETPGIDQSVMNALGNTLTGEHNQQLSVGNPDHQLDALHTFAVRDDVVHVRISALDHPNLVTGTTIMPGGPSRKWLYAMSAQHGDGAQWHSRVRGVSPEESEEALIKLAWCREAVKLAEDRTLRTGRKAIGLDVAQSENGDKACTARGDGAVLLSVDEEVCNNATVLGEVIRRELEVDYERGGRPLCGVDPIGVGAAAYNELRDTPGVFALNGGATPHDAAQRTEQGDAGEWMADSNEFVNLRAQMYWQLREDLRLGHVALPDDEELHRQLTMPKWKKVAGKVLLEAKVDIKKRLGRSPDKADAAVYWNWVRARAPREVVGAEVRAFDPAVLAAERERTRRRDPLRRPDEFGARPGSRWHPGETT